MRNGIIGAGNWVLDKVKNIDRWPGEGNLCNITGEVFAPGGGPANVLFDINAADPALPLYAAGKLGADSEGDYLMAEIERRGIDGKNMKRSSKVPTSYTDVMSGNGKRTFFHCRGANAELCCEDLENIDVPAKFFYLGYLLLLDSLDAADSEYGTKAVRLLKTMREKGYKTVVDFVSEAPEKFRSAVLPALPCIDILIVNEVETACCCGFDLRSADGKLLWQKLPEAVDFMLENGVRETVVIHFPEGACAKARGGEYIYRPSCFISREEIVGSNGAGDAFCAGVMYALHQEWPLEKALALGGASSNFNLRSATASGGAVSLEKMLDYLKECKFEALPEGMSENYGK